MKIKTINRWMCYSLLIVGIKKVHQANMDTALKEWRVMSSCICLFVGWFVGWFVSRFAQKLLNTFPRNLDGIWVFGQNRSPLTFRVDPDKGTEPGFFFSVSLELQDRGFVDISIHFSGNRFGWYMSDSALLSTMSGPWISQTLLEQKTTFLGGNPLNIW